MKKILFIILLMIISISNVYALTDEEKLQILNIKQGNNELKIENEKYIIEDYNKSLFLNYKIINYNKKKKYLLIIKNDLDEEETINYENIFNETSLDWIYASNLHEDTTYEYTLCIAKSDNDNTCQKELDKKIVVLSFKDYNKLSKNSKLRVKKVVQGNKEIFPEADQYNLNYYYNLNSKELVTISLKGENFVNDIIYRINDDYHIYNHSEGTGGLFYTGKEINDGITVSIPCSLGYCQGIYATMDAINDSAIFNTIIVNDEEKTVHFNTYDDESIYDYNAFMTYDDKEESIFEIDPDIYNIDKTMNVLIDGNNFLNKDYSVSIEVSHNDNLVYEDNLVVNGLLLNNNYRYKIKNLPLNYFKSYNDTPYQVLVKVDYIYKKIGFVYIYPGTIDLELYYGKDSKKINFTFGSGDLHGSFSGCHIKPSDINVDNKIKIQYSGSLFDDNKIYKYKILYEPSNKYSISDNAITLKEENISGYELNNNGIIFEDNLNILSKDDNYLYSLLVTYYDSFVYKKDLAINKTADIEYESGDLNKNNKIDLKDIILLIKKYLGTENYTEEDLIIGDMNNNSKLDLKDIIILIRTYLGME